MAKCLALPWLYNENRVVLSWCASYIAPAWDGEVDCSFCLSSELGDTKPQQSKTARYACVGLSLWACSCVWKWRITRMTLWLCNGVRVICTFCVLCTSWVHCNGWSDKTWRMYSVCVCVCDGCTVAAVREEPHNPWILDRAPAARTLAWMASADTQPYEILYDWQSAYEM